MGSASQARAAGLGRVGPVGGVGPVGWMGRGLAELEAVEGAGGAPLVDVGEVGAGAVGVAVAEELTRVLALVVVIARRAVWSADHAARSGQQQLDPRRLGGGRRFDGAEPTV